MGERIRRGAIRSVSRAARARRGGATVLLAGVLMIMTALMLASFMVGRAAVHKEELQAGSDAVAIAAARTALYEGVHQGRRMERFMPFAQGNNLNRLTGVPLLSTQAVPARNVLEITVGLETTALSDNVGLTGLDKVDVRARSVAQVYNVRKRLDLDREPPRIVLVLDYSGSMGADFGGGRTRNEALEESVSHILALNLQLPGNARVRWGLVTYSTDVMDVVSVGVGTEGAIGAVMGDRGPGGNTRTHKALQRARQLVGGQPRDHRYVILVSDGLPNGGDPVPESDRLRLTDNTNVYCLEIRAPGSPPMDVMQRMAGPAGDPNGRNPDYVKTARNVDSLHEALLDIWAGIYCTVKLDDPKPSEVGWTDEDGNLVVNAWVLNPASGQEEQVSISSEGEDTYRIGDMETCAALLENGTALDFRFGKPVLVQ